MRPSEIVSGDRAHSPGLCREGLLAGYRVRNCLLRPSVKMSDAVSARDGSTTIMNARPGLPVLADPPLRREPIRLLRRAAPMMGGARRPALRGVVDTVVVGRVSAGPSPRLAGDSVRMVDPEGGRPDLSQAASKACRASS